MKFIFSFVLILASSNSFSQSRTMKPFIDIGPKVLVGPSMFKSNVITGTEDTYLHSFKSFGWKAGFKIGINFNESIGLVAEGLLGSNQQVFKRENLENGSLKEIKESNLEFPVMFRYNNSSAGFLEVGYVFGKIRKVHELENSLLVDRTNLYNTNRNGLIFGLGGWLWGNKTIGLSAGVRVRYDLDDALSTSPEDRIANSSTFALDNQVVGSVNPWSVMFSLELNYDFGLIMARSPCTGRRKVFFVQ